SHNGAGLNNLAFTLGKMTGTQVAGLISSTDNFDSIIMTFAKNQLSASELGILALNLSPESTNALITILANTNIAGKSLSTVMTAMGVDNVRKLAQTVGLSDASQILIFQTAVGALGNDGAVELLLMGVPALSVDLKQQFLTAVRTSSQSNFDNLIAAVAHYSKNGASGAGLAAVLINNIGSSDLQGYMLVSIAASANISNAIKGNILMNLASTSLKDSFIDKLNLSSTLDDVMVAMGTTSLAALLETTGLNSYSWTNIMAITVSLLNANGAGAQSVADALVLCLNQYPGNTDFVTRFSTMLVNNPTSANMSNLISNAFTNNWNQEGFAQLSLAMISVTTASNFTTLNSLLTKITNVDADVFFNSLKAQALTGDAKVQAYLREALLAATRGLINDSANALGRLQAEAVIFAVSQNMDRGGSLVIFGSASRPINIDWIAIASENLFQVSGPEIQGQLSNAMLTGLIGFDTTAGSDTGEYYTNIMRVALIAQGVNNSLLSAVGHSSELSSYLANNNGLMANDFTAALSSLLNRDLTFIGHTGSDYYVQYTVFDTGELRAIDRSYGSNYATTSPNSYRALHLLGTVDRSDLGITLDYSLDVSDWNFPLATHPTHQQDPNDNGTARP
ncbi:MAG: hypothetical protein WCH76_07540, partial [Candidatus Riflemargulisbacteria bacterium]